LKGAARGLLLLLEASSRSASDERLLRQVMADQTVVSQLLAPGAASASLVAAAGYFVLRLLVVRLPAGLVLGRLARLMLLHCGRSAVEGGAELPGGRLPPPKSARRLRRARAFWGT